MARILKIVLADDDPDDHFLFINSLKALDFASPEVTSIYDGKQLLDYLLCREWYRNWTRPKPDVLVLDLNMPRVNGYEALKELRNLRDFDHLPIFILSSGTDPSQIQQCLHCGVSGFYQKPPDSGEYATVVNEILRKAMSQPAG